MMETLLFTGKPSPAVTQVIIQNGQWRLLSAPLTHAPLIAMTPSRVPRNAVPPTSDGDEKCGSPPGIDIW